MANFIENVSKYLSEKKIKQTYLSLKSGIEPSKLSRLLNGGQSVTDSDMEQISEALGQKVEYFLQKDFHIAERGPVEMSEIAFYAGEPKKEQEQFAHMLIELIENADEVISAKGRYLMTEKE